MPQGVAVSAMPPAPAPPSPGGIAVGRSGWYFRYTMIGRNFSSRRSRLPFGDVSVCARCASRARLGLAYVVQRAAAAMTRLRAPALNTVLRVADACYHY